MLALLLNTTYRPGQVEVRWVPDNSGMRVKSSKQDKNEKMERTTKEEEVGMGSKQSMEKQNMDDNVEKKTMDRMESKAKEFELHREDL